MSRPATASGGELEHGLGVIWTAPRRRGHTESPLRPLARPGGTSAYGYSLIDAAPAGGVSPLVETREATLRLIGRSAIAISALLSGLCLLACSTPTPYQADLGDVRVAGGYSEERLGEARYRVTFSATIATPRSRLEAYLARRAAELTLREGYEWFTLSAPRYEQGMYAYNAPDNRYSVRHGGGYDEWRSYWRFFRFGLGWQRYDGDPFWWQKDQARSSRRIEVHAEVTMGRGAPSQGSAGIFRARPMLDEVNSRNRKSTGGQRT